MRKTLYVGAAVLALLSWQVPSVAAQDPSAGGQGSTTAAAKEKVRQTGKAAKKTAKSAEEKAGAAVPDKAFVLKAASGGLLEVELGKMAQNQASNDDVKKFGQRMVDDHSKANNDLSALAQKKNITLPMELDAKDKAVHDRMAKLNGAAFDSAYMRDMVADHTKDVRDFEKESKTGKDPDVKAWAGQVLPTLQDHLKVAKQTASEVTKGGAAKKSGKSGKKSESGK